MGRALAVDDVDIGRDRDLVEAAQAGDPTAFAELYTRYFNRLVRFAAKRVGDTHEAEEIAQEAFARAYRALPEFGGERRFYPWMTVIAGRLCIDAVRRRGRLQVGEVIDEAILDAGFDRLDRQGDIDKINVAMLRLSERHREILQLRERDGWSYQHIAEHLEVSLGTVEALLWRARRALRREYTSLGAAILCLPGVRRLVVRHPTQPSSVLAVVGSVGTALALSWGTWGGITAAAAATAPAPAATAVHVAAKGTSPAPAAPPPPLAVTPPAVGAPPAAASRGSVPAPAAADPIAIVPVLMSHQAARGATQSSPIHLITPSDGPAVGVDPSAATHNALTYLGVTK